jgi:hypothetical protein
MGMYDNFVIDYPLPIEGWVPDEYKPMIQHTFAADGFQSKDLECLLKNYYISNDGHIFLDELCDFESNEPFKRNQIYFHGHIKVHTFVLLDEESDPIYGPSLWFNYDLKFTDSLLVSAIMISPTKEQIDELHRNLQ